MKNKIICILVCVLFIAGVFFNIVSAQTQSINENYKSLINDEDNKVGEISLSLDEGVVKKSTVLTDICTSLNRILNFRFNDVPKKGMTYKKISANCLFRNFILWF